MKIEINKEDLKDIVSPEFLAEILADEIIRSKTDRIWNEFNEELLKAVKDSTKRIVDEIMEDYLEGRNIRTLVERVLRDMTKEEIIKVFSKSN